MASNGHSKPRGSGLNLDLLHVRKVSASLVVGHRGQVGKLACLVAVVVTRGRARPARVFPLGLGRQAVGLALFAAGKCEVTVGQFRRFTEDWGYKTEAERDDKGGWEEYEWRPATGIDESNVVFSVFGSRHPPEMPHRGPVSLRYCLSSRPLIHLALTPHPSQENGKV